MPRRIRGRDSDAVVVRAKLKPRPKPAKAADPPGTCRRPAYVARLLALAHQLRGVLERGEVSGVGELARRLGVSQPRVTQILNLTYLSPAIQAYVVSLEAADGVEPMTERPLREAVKSVGWWGQRYKSELAGAQIHPDHLSTRGYPSIRLSDRLH
ncbi:MAG: hypothetical protein H6718_06745 [Polyangiaceae bacterium]|nr:hypothetical protein [Polyangiaceae bacterium]